MSNSKLTIESTAAAQQSTKEKLPPGEKPAWETPKLEDVSEQVMAQPYIRFT